MGRAEMPGEHEVPVDLVAVVEWPDGQGRTYLGPDYEPDDPREVTEIRGATPEDQAILDAIEARDAAEHERRKFIETGRLARTTMDDIRCRVLESHGADEREAVDASGMRIALAVLSHVEGSLMNVFTRGEDAELLRSLALGPAADGRESGRLMHRSLLRRTPAIDEAGPGIRDFVDGLRAAMERVADELNKRIREKNGPVVTWPTTEETKRAES